MEQVIEQRVIGQSEAVKAICNAIRISRAGLSAGTRPLGTFLFLGPTGVGKTLVTDCHLPKLIETVMQGALCIFVPRSQCNGSN